jgi:N-methylhydantoinase B
LFGGQPGRPGSVTLNPDTPAAVELPSKIPYRRARAGDVLRLVGPCGGGYGDPALRDPEAIARDARDGIAVAS